MSVAREGKNRNQTISAVIILTLLLFLFDRITNRNDGVTQKLKLVFAGHTQQSSSLNAKSCQ
jgi:fucose permease